MSNFIIGLITSLSDEEYKRYVYDAVYPYDKDISVFDNIRLWDIDDIRHLIAYHYLCNKDDRKYTIWKIKNGYEVDKSIINYFKL